MGAGNRPIFKIPPGDFEHGYLRRYRVYGGSMDHLARLIVAALCFVAFPALADVYTISNRGATGSGSTALAAYTSWAAAYNATLEVACIHNGQNTSAWQAAAATQFDDAGKRIRVQFNESPLISGSYQCGWAPIYDWVSYTASGSPAQCPPAGDVVAPAGTVYEAGNGLTNVVCLAGCEASALMAAMHEGRNWVWGPIISTGAQCQSAPPVSDASPKCAVGQCPGTFNGSQICVPCNETKQDKSSSSSESSASAASGAASGPASTSTKDGSSSTTCKGESCTTTSRETVVNPDGSTDTKEVTTTQSKSDYCKDNPKAGACTGSESTWGGTCQAFTCDGDAVQCAQARGAWELACQLKTESTDPTVRAGTEAMAGTGEAAIKDQLGMNTSQGLDLASRLDSTSLFGTAGACPSDTTLTLGIGSVTLPFASMCPQLNLIGVAMMGLAYLIAAFIVFRPSKGA